MINRLWERSHDKQTVRVRTHCSSLLLLLNQLLRGRSCSKVSCRIILAANSLKKPLKPFFFWLFWTHLNITFKKSQVFWGVMHFVQIFRISSLFSSFEGAFRPPTFINLFRSSLGCFIFWLRHQKISWHGLLQQFNWPESLSFPTTHISQHRQLCFLEISTPTVIFLEEFSIKSCSSENSMIIQHQKLYSLGNLTPKVIFLGKHSI